MPFSALYASGMAELAARGYANDISNHRSGRHESRAHRAAHGAGLYAARRRALRGDDELTEVIRTSRIFVSPTEQQLVGPRMVLTVEPRIGAPDLPTVGYHLLVAVDEQGRTTVIDDLAPVEKAYRKAVLARE